MTRKTLGLLATDTGVRKPALDLTNFPDTIVVRRVRQGCILKPLIFNLYSEKIFERSFHDNQIGIKINGVKTNNLRSKDETVLIGNSDIDLLDRVVVDRVVAVWEEYELQLYIKKTKYMVQILSQPLETSNVLYPRILSRPLAIDLNMKY